MINIGGKEVDNGSHISFRTKEIADQNVYIGVVTGILTDVDLVKGVEDIVQKHQDLRADDPSITEDINELTFLVVMTDAGTDPKKVFATEWIDPATLTIISVTNEAVLKLINVTEAKVVEIMSQLTDDNVKVRRLS